MDTIGISQTDFLSGEISMTFDLEKARDAAKFDDHMAITMFPLAIAEIERLRAEISEQKGMIWKTQQVKKEQAAQIKSLEDALAEYQRLGKTIAGKVPCLTLHGDCGRCSAKMREVCGALEQIGGKIGPDVNEKQSDELVAAYREMRDLARCAPGSAMHRKAIERYDALRAEGKIGPDAETGNRDHVVGPDQMVPCWQITEDRVTAIDQGLRFLEWSNAKTGNVETKKRIVILKTMLEEASDEHGFER
jgi:hypothetical protein